MKQIDRYIWKRDPAKILQRKPKIFRRLLLHLFHASAERSSGPEARKPSKSTRRSVRAGLKVIAEDRITAQRGQPVIAPKSDAQVRVNLKLCELETRADLRLCVVKH